MALHCLVRGTRVELASSTFTAWGFSQLSYLPTCWWNRMSMNRDYDIDRLRVIIVGVLVPLFGGTNGSRTRIPFRDREVL